MSNELIIFDFNNIAVRTVYQKNQVWLCLIDICTVLGINDRAQLRRRLNRRGMCLIPTPSNSGLQKTYYINEPNLYRTILKSDKPEAQKFENWVCEEVLPSVRKTGSYSVDKPVVVSEHTRALPSGKKEIVLSKKAKEEIGGITKAVVTKSLDEKLSQYLGRDHKLDSKIISDAFHQTVEEIQNKKRQEHKSYMLSEAEAAIIEKIRSDKAFNMLSLYMGVSQKLEKAL